MPHPKPDPALAAAIRRLREERGTTREVLAYCAGLTTGALARIELARSSPRWVTVCRVADALDLSVTQLAGVVEAAPEPALAARNSSALLARALACE